MQEQLLCNLDIVLFKSIFAHCNWNMSEKLRLHWNDFQENINVLFGNLRGNGEFSDVTLACEDGQQFEGHKVVLAASSPVFQNLLKMSKLQNHPLLIYLRGFKSEDLSAILDFLYCGEASISQESLESFLAIAGELQLKGFADGELFSSQNPTEIKTNPNLTQPITCKGTDQELSNGDFNFDHIVAIPKYLSADLQELTKQVNSMIIKSQNMIPNGKRRCTASICKVCGKEGAPQTIKDHVEAHHLEGVSLPCNTCGKTFR